MLETLNSHTPPLHSIDEYKIDFTNPAAPVATKISTMPLPWGGSGPCSTTTEATRCITVPVNDRRLAQLTLSQDRCFIGGAGLNMPHGSVFTPTPSTTTTCNFGNTNVEKLNPGNCPAPVTLALFTAEWYGPIQYYSQPNFGTINAYTATDIPRATASGLACTSLECTRPQYVPDPSMIVADRPVVFYATGASAASNQPNRNFASRYPSTVSAAAAAGGSLFGVPYSTYWGASGTGGLNVPANDQLMWPVALDTTDTFGTQGMAFGTSNGVSDASRQHRLVTVARLSSGALQTWPSTGRNVPIVPIAYPPGSKYTAIMPNDAYAVLSSYAIPIITPSQPNFYGSVGGGAPVDLSNIAAYFSSEETDSYGNRMFWCVQGAPDGQAVQRGRYVDGAWKAPEPLWFSKTDPTNRFFSDLDTVGVAIDLYLTRTVYVTTLTGLYVSRSAWDEVPAQVFFTLVASTGNLYANRGVAITPRAFCPPPLAQPFF